MTVIHDLPKCLMQYTASTVSAGAIDRGKL